MHTVCDVPISFEEVLAEYGNKFPNLDCSFIDTEKYDNWFVSDLNSEAQVKIEATKLPT